MQQGGEAVLRVRESIVLNGDWGRGMALRQPSLSNDGSVASTFVSQVAPTGSGSEIT